MPTGTLLIIDDEARLRQLLAQVLALEGYTVPQAPDATRGLELLRQRAAKRAKTPKRGRQQLATGPALGLGWG